VGDRIMGGRPSGLFSDIQSSGKTGRVEATAFFPDEFGMCASSGIIITYFLPKNKLIYWYRKVQENAL
jgi:hypothetical protein